MCARDTVRSKEPPTDRRKPASDVHSVRPAKEPVDAARHAGKRQPTVSATGPIASDPPQLARAAAYSVPFDGWFHELDKVLVNLCQRGRDGERQAIAAIRAGHPQISATTIWARIVYLGLTTSKRPPYRRHEWCAEDLEVLGTGYRHGRSSTSRTIDALLEQHPDWSRSVIWRKAKSLGLSRSRNGGYRAWSEEADRMLISCEGFEMEEIERRMKRSIASIRSRLAVLDRGAEFFGGFKTKDLMEMLHLDELAIRRLERTHLLLRERGRITEDSLRSLCREHPEEIPFETLDGDTKQMLAVDYRYAKPKGARRGGRKKQQPPGNSTGDSNGK
jgi:hypothetical protein